MRITVNPNVDTSGFGHVEPGVYRLRVVKCDYAEKNYPYLKWEYEFVDPNVKATDEKLKPGYIYENTTLKSEGNAQFRLRQQIEALGLEWADFDTENVIGLEFDADVGLGEPREDGTIPNVIKRYIPAKK